MSGLALRVRVPGDADDVLRYGVASGDLHGLHHRPDSPEAMALGGCVLPGRYQLGVIARLLREALEPGSEILELECVYLTPAPVGAPLWLEVRGREGPERALALRIRLVGEDGGLLLTGRASVARRAR